MAYNIGEKPDKGSYVCPQCGYRAGKVTAIVRRDVADAWSPTDTVENSRTHSASLRSTTPVLFLAALMFVGGFATKALLTEVPIETRAGSNANSNSRDDNLNVSSGNANVSPANANISPGNPNVTVWVNTNSGVYHCSNTRWYGNTKSGQYMTQQEAQSKGYRPAHGSACG